jgi:NADPH:quinone reductase-like Zn-dependent oxidoreductase
VGGEDGGRWIGGTVARDFKALAISPCVKQNFVASPAQERLLVLAGLIESGELVPVIDRSYAPSEVRNAIRDLEAGRIRGKAVIPI